MEGIRLPEHWTSWKLTEEIGSGAYGRVYKAEMTEGDGRPAAVKIISVPSDKSEADALYREYRSMEEVSRYYSNVMSNLVAEIQALMSLKGCENIVQIEDYHVEKISDNNYGWNIYIRMEYLKSLSDYLQDHDIDEGMAVRIGTDLCRALEECQKVSIIHRDIKPDNILVSKDGRFKLGDFGVAGNLESSSLSIGMKGTFSYMAPEVYYGKSCDHTSDIYSLGLVLFRLLNKNREPFVDTDKQIINFRDRERAMGERMKGTPLPDPLYASKDMAKVIRRACSFEVGDRYPDASAMRADLERVRDGIFTESAAGEAAGDVPEPLKKKDRRDRPEISESGPDRRAAGNRIGKLLFAAVLLASGIIAALAFHFTAVRNERVFADQSCSPDGDVRATLYKDGRLLISGNGCLGPSVQYGALPWDDYKDDIKKVVIEEGVTSLDENVFNFCSHLAEADLPEGLVRIGSSAFEECSLLQDVQIPASLEEIGDRAFYNTKWLSLMEDDEGFLIVNGILLKYSGQAENLRIPETVSVINDQAFEGNGNLVEVTLPEGLKAIGNFAFRDCGKLSRINGLTDNNGIQDIGAEAFRDTPWLENQLAKGKGLAVIGTRLLAYRGQAREVEIPEGIETISGCAFGENDHMEKITIPASVRVIGLQAFYDCTRLKELTFEGDDLKTIPAQMVQGCVSLKEISLPDQVESIGEEAFSGCVSLEKIRLPAGLKEIGNNAFLGCVNLEKVEEPSSIDRQMIREAFIGSPWYDNVYEMDN